MAAVGSLGSTNSESAARSAAGSVSERAVNGDTASPTTGTWSASSKSRIARNSAAIRMIPARESSGIVMNVPVSARSTASARAFGPRTAITTGVWKSDASLTEAGNLGGGVAITADEKRLAEAIIHDIGEAAVQLGSVAFGKQLPEVQKRLQSGPMP